MNPFNVPKYDAALPKTFSQIRNNIAYILTYAPNDFPKKDYLPDDKQSDLEGEFWILHNSLAIICTKQELQEILPEIEALLVSSFKAFKNQDRKRGLDLLNEFEDLIFD